MSAPRTAAVLLLGPLLLGATGCNDGPVGRAASPDRAESDDPAARASEPPPEATSSPSAASVDPAAASAAAAAINLTGRDLPTFTATPQDGAPVATEPERALARCLGSPEPGPVLRSDGFVRGPQDSALLVASAVEVVQDADVAAEAVDAYESEEAPQCVAEFVETTLTQLAGASGITLSPLDVIRLEPDAVDGAHGFRVTTTATGRAEPLPFTVDVLRFARDRTQVALYAIGVGTALPETERDDLLATLAERAEEHAL